jgi:phosphotransferase system HPr-like phosphotransfer protein
VELSQDPRGLHLGPISQVARGILRRNATIVLSRDGQSCTLDTRIPAFELIRAAGALSLGAGAAFEIACDGPEAEAAFDALRQGFTEGPFAGSTFTPLPPSPEADSDG